LSGEDLLETKLFKFQNFDGLTMNPVTDARAVSEEYGLSALTMICDEIFTELDMIFEGFQAELANLEWKM
jgi:hypothetical protein